MRWAQSSLVRFSPFFVIFFAFVFLQFTDDVWLAISTPKQQMAERIQQTMMMLISVHKRKMKMCNRTKWRESEDAAAAFLLVNIFLFCFLYFSTAWVPSDRVKPLVELDAFSTMNTYV